MKQSRSRNLATLVWLLVVVTNVPAQSKENLVKENLAPGAPGKDAKWANAGKQGVGTSNTLQSKVWFTLQGGVLTEVFYPSVDMPNVQVLQFIVVDAARPTGERAEYEIARGEFAQARERLDTMLGFANDGMMLPEQVWDR